MSNNRSSIRTSTSQSKKTEKNKFDPRRKLLLQNSNQQLSDNLGFNYYVLIFTISDRLFRSFYEDEDVQINDDDLVDNSFSKKRKGASTVKGRHQATFEDEQPFDDKITKLNVNHQTKTTTTIIGNPTQTSSIIKSNRQSLQDSKESDKFSPIDQVNESSNVNESKGKGKRKSLAFVPNKEIRKKIKRIFPLLPSFPSLSPSSYSIFDPRQDFNTSLQSFLANQFEAELSLINSTYSISAPHLYSIIRPVIEATLKSLPPYLSAKVENHSVSPADIQSKIEIQEIQSLLAKVQSQSDEWRQLQDKYTTISIQIPKHKLTSKKTSEYHNAYFSSICFTKHYRLIMFVALVLDDDDNFLIAGSSLIKRLPEQDLAAYKTISIKVGTEYSTINLPYYSFKYSLFNLIELLLGCCLVCCLTQSDSILKELRKLLQQLSSLSSYRERLTQAVNSTVFSSSTGTTVNNQTNTVNLIDHADARKLITRVIQKGT